MPTACLMLLVASSIVFGSSFLTWVQFRPQVPAGMGNLMDAEMLAMLAATGWNGDVTLAGLTVPNWFVPVMSIALVGFALMRTAEVWEAPRGLVITFTTYCMLHLGFLCVVVMLAGASQARLGLGAMLGMLASVGAFAASLKRDGVAPSRAPDYVPSGSGGFGRVIGTPRSHGSVDDVPASHEFDSRPHQHS